MNLQEYTLLILEILGITCNCFSNSEGGKILFDKLSDKERILFEEEYRKIAKYKLDFDWTSGCHKLAPYLMALAKIKESS
jgi:hypothetical protein